MEQWGNNYLTNSTTGAAHIGSCPYSQSTHFYQNFIIFQMDHMQMNFTHIQLYGKKIP